MTRRPLLSSTPENSRPAISGGAGVPGYPPFVVMKSAKFSPPAATRITVCPVFGVGSGTSCTASASGPERLVMTSAFMSESLNQTADRFPSGASNIETPGAAIRPLSIRHGVLAPAFPGRYILLAWIPDRPAEPQQAGTGRTFYPLIHASRIRKADPAGGGGKGNGCIAYGSRKQCIRGEVYRGYHSCTSSFCHSRRNYLLRDCALWTNPRR